MVLFGIWNILGFGILAGLLFTLETDGAIGAAEGIEFVNPVFVHKHNRVNWFGAFVVATFYGLICPVATIGYWFYKICTIGVK